MFPAAPTPASTRPHDTRAHTRTQSVRTLAPALLTRTHSLTHTGQTYTFTHRYYQEHAPTQETCIHICKRPRTLTHTHTTHTSAEINTRVRNRLLFNRRVMSPLLPLPRPKLNSHSITCFFPQMAVLLQLWADWDHSGRNISPQWSPVRLLCLLRADQISLAPCACLPPCLKLCARLVGIAVASGGQGIKHWNDGAIGDFPDVVLHAHEPWVRVVRIADASSRIHTLVDIPTDSL